MIDSTAIQQNQAVSAHIAAMTAEFERLNGPIETTPIQLNWKPQPFQIANPDKPKAEPKKPKAPTIRKAANERKPRADMLAKREKIERMKVMAAAGKTAAEIAALVGWELGHCRKVMAQHNITPTSAHIVELPLVRHLAASGSTIEQMAEASGKNRKTIIKWLREYNVVRGPKMNLDDEAAK
jgi:hypothetical protein